MVTKRQMFGMLVGVVLASSYGFSQESVEATKEAPTGAAGVISSSSSSLELRNYHAQKRPDQDASSVSQQVRLNVGVNTLADKVQTTAVLGGIKKADSTQLTVRRPEIVTEWYAVDTTYADLIPTLWLRTPQAGKDTEFQPGTQIVFSAPVATAVGNLKPFLALEGYAYFHSRKEDAKVSNPEDANQDQLTLVGTDKNMIDDGKKDSTLENWTYVGTEYTPNFANGLSMKVSLGYTRTFEPTYELQDDGSTTMRYAPTQATENRLLVSYALTDKLSLANDFYYYLGGLYETGYSKPGSSSIYGLLNLTKLVYTVY